MLTPFTGHLRSGRAAARFVRLARHQAHVRCAAAHIRYNSAVAAADDTEAAAAGTLGPLVTKDLSVPSTARINEIGVQQLSEHLYSQLFPNEAQPPPEELVELSREHLRRHDLLDKNTDQTPPIAFDLPPLQAPDTNTLDEHFYRLGADAAEPFLEYAHRFATSVLPRVPNEWVHQSGWTKYYFCDDGNGPAATEKVEAPDEKMLSFDVEVMWKESKFAVMACAASPTAWYVWLSPWLLGESKNMKQLIPLGDPTKERIIVGHNVGYDRARILEEYDLKQTRNFFLDTMSLHVAVNGMCSQQRPTWMKHQKNRDLREQIARNPESVALNKMLDADTSNDEEDLWIGKSSINSLRDVAKFHLNLSIDKTVRDDFGELNREQIVNKLDDLLNYCAADVNVTHRVYSIVFPNFRETCPHPVSFAALRHMSTVILPVNKSWDRYIKKAEATYQDLSTGVLQRLEALTYKALEIKQDAEKWSEDPWLKQLDWSGQEIKMTKAKKNQEPRPVKNQKLPGQPQWFKDLHPKKDGPMNLTIRTRVAPLLLRLSWDGHPLFWSDVHGWTFRVPLSEVRTYKQKAMTFCDMKDEKIEMLKNDTEGAYFKVPHKDGPTARCANPMAKSYLAYFEKGILTSEYPYAKEALEMNAYCSYWISARERIRSQLVVYEGDLQPNDESEDQQVEASVEGDLQANDESEDQQVEASVEGDLQPKAASEDQRPEGSQENLPPKNESGGQHSQAFGEGELPPKEGSEDQQAKVVEEGDHAPAEESEDQQSELGFILPQIIPMGTITRRAVENTWLTASNAKKTRVGSELKAMVKAPPGYSFVGADVDSEELWIASVLGDAVFKIHGGNAIGFMTLEGTKAAGTDLHSRTASILGITRGHAKIFNYGRIYGAGLKFAAQLLRQFNPSLSERDTVNTATKLYTATKGMQTDRRALYKRKFWRGGTESFVFNKLEEFAEQERPRTPVLGAGITEALMSRYVSKGGFLTSRINWAIQSSGVDYLHLLIVAMDYLIRRFNIDARLAITVHDEIRYLVKDHDRYRTAMALQVANIWTRCMFAQQIGINDLPQACAFFSAVDIDHVLRKEVDLDCVTPSQPNPIPPGESIDIYQLLQMGDEARLDESIVPENHAPQLDKITYVPRIPVMEELIEEDASTADTLFIRAQITNDMQELNKICSEKRNKVAQMEIAKPKMTELPYSPHAELVPQEEPTILSETFRHKPPRLFSGVSQKKIDLGRNHDFKRREVFRGTY